EQKELLADLRADGEAATNELDRYVGLKFSAEPDDRRLLIVVDQFEEVFTYRPQDDQARVRFLGVLGPSGSGKSSVVLAGLVPSLEAGTIEGSARWPVAILRPGDNPLQSLTGKVVPLLREEVRPDPSLSKSGEQKELLADLRADGEEAATELDRYVGLKFSAEPADRRLLIVVDQCEEVFTYRPQDDQARARFERDRAAFFANLLHAAAAPGGRVAVVLTMRSDFLSACAPFPQLAAVLSAHQELVGPMTAAELREAIERPAYLVGCEVEAPLTERLLADVKGQSGALPLLQFALTEAWKKREVRRLTLRAYTELGKDAKGEPRGIEGVLDHRADEIYRNLSPEAQHLCQRLFLRLVQPGEGTEDTKRRVPYRELLPEDPARAAAVCNLVQTLADRDARLITTGDARLITTEGGDATEGTVEVAHEALIRGWTQLRQWIEAERAGLRTQRRLTEAAQEWAAARPEHQADYLYSGARLAVSREWAATHRDELNPIEAAFLATSEGAERQRQADEAEKNRRLAESERQRAEEAEARKREAEQSEIKEKQARKEAEKNASLAQAQARIATSRLLAAASASERNKSLDRSLLLAVEALRTEITLEARGSLYNALQDRPGLTSFLHVNEGDVRSMAFSPDGKTLAAGYSGGVVLWDVAAGQRLGDEPLPVREGIVGGVAFSPDGKTLAAGYSGFGVGGVVLWDVAAGQRLGDEPLPVREGDVGSVAFSPDGKTLAAGYSGGFGRVGGVVLWDVA
ncbi:MAG: hypothetical protein JO252_20885, partial [Planctomycetaceae bacterium]|nr:hypothetical protein [Planctomycetaceae bacterium]